MATFSDNRDHDAAQNSPKSNNSRDAVRVLRAVAEIFANCCSRNRETGTCTPLPQIGAAITSFSDVLAGAQITPWSQAEKLALFQRTVESLVSRNTLYLLHRGFAAALGGYEVCLARDGVRASRVLPLQEFCNVIHDAVKTAIEPELDSCKARELTTLFVLALFYRHLLRLKAKEAEAGCDYVAYVSVANIETSFLESLLLGQSTGSTGLDYVLGGGGLVLGVHNAVVGGVPQRNTCIVGEPAAGKTSVALLIAATVARSGGIAVYVSLDSGSTPPKYLLSNLGVSLDGSEFYTLVTTDGVLEVVSAMNDDSNGVLAFLTIKRSEYSQAAKTISKYCEDVKKRLLINRKLIVVLDPANSLMLTGPHEEIRVDHSDEAGRFTLREGLLSGLEELNRDGFNTLITLEDALQPEIDQFIAVADTVIRLKSECMPHGTKRYVAVEKSRRQREFPGWHEFVIEGENGVTVYPNIGSVAAVDRKRRSRRLEKQSEYSAFGLDSLDRLLQGDASMNGMKEPAILEAESIGTGDVILLQGPLGTFKTHLALCFCHWFSRRSVGEIRKSLHGKNRRAKIASDANAVGMIISLRVHDLTTRTMNPVYQSTLASRDRTLAQALGLRCQHATAAFSKDLVTCPVPGPFVSASELTYLIDNAIAKQRSTGRFVDRVLIDCPSDWDDLCPGIADTPGFAQTILGHLRHRSITTIVTERFAQETSIICRTVRKMADTIIYLNSFKDGSTESAFVRIVRSKLMRHNPNQYVFETDSKQGLHVNDESDALRFSSENATPSVVSAQAYLPVENEGQRRRYDRIESLVKDATNVNLVVSPASVVEIENYLALANTAQKDEVKIVGLEEFHDFEFLERNIAPRRGTTGRLRKSNSIYDSSNQFCVQRLQDNVGIFLTKQVAPLNSWRRIKEKVEDDTINFRYAFRHREDLNSLFLEILVAEIGEQRYEAAAALGVAALIDLIPEIGDLTRTLLHPQFRYFDCKQICNLPNLVCRQWFLSERNGLDAFDVCLPPRKILASGNWLAGVARSSTSPVTAEKILDTLCNLFNEPDRLESQSGFAAFRSASQVAKQASYLVHRHMIADYCRDSEALFQAIDDASRTNTHE